LILFFNDYKTRLDKHEVNFRFHHHADPLIAIVQTDTYKLKQVLTNLLSNAFKFTETGSIECGYCLENNKLQFYVRDTGIGIPEDKFEFVFERFSQLKHPSVQNAGGTGLGLAIVKGLVNLLGGTVWLESQIDKGTTFYFTIDFVPAGSIITNPHAPETAQKTTTQKTILIVEDDICNAKYLKGILENVSSNIITATNGLAAMKIAKEQRVDLILMDIWLPDITGYEATSLILQDNQDTKVIAQTAFAENNVRQKAIEAGCVDYICKPTKRDELLQMIDKYLK
jgi:CheY-like chemotaxis protein/anti-sigma regulatory factor (Ser/Thr protein kinase)